MARIAVIVFQNMRYAPFLSFYESLLSEMEDTEYDVIYYNRYRDLNETEDEHHIAIPWYGKGTNAASKAEKAINFVAYAKNMKKILKVKNYDFLIILMTMPAVLLGNYLINYYKGRYTVDIRDYTQEYFAPYYRMETKVVLNSACNVISSPGYKNFLPPADYLTCHNISNITVPDLVYCKRKTRPIIISYIGSISYENQCKRLIDLVSADNRFAFYFYGNESTSNEISRYVKLLDNPEIKMMGPFLPNEKFGIYNESDLVFNCYGNDQMLVKYAISNKHYDGALFRRPLLVSPKTTMEDIGGEFAFPLDLDEVQNLDSLYEWHLNLDEKKYDTFARGVVKNAQKENLETKQRIINEIRRVIHQRLL